MFIYALFFYLTALWGRRKRIMKKGMRLILTIGVVFTALLIVGTAFSVSVYAKPYGQLSSVGKMKKQTSLFVDVNKKAFNKALRYSQIDLIIDFNAVSPHLIEKVPLYSPQGKLIYYYVLFKDEKGKVYFSIVSVSYRYSPVICEGAGYGYISSLHKAEPMIIDKAFRKGILRPPMRAQILHYVYFGQLNFGYLFHGGFSYALGTDGFLNNVNFEEKPSALIKYREHTRELWDTVNETLKGRYYTKSWWTQGMLYDPYVPYIAWYKGCVPTSIAMIIGYLCIYGYIYFPYIEHVVDSDGYYWISDDHAKEVIEFLVNYWHLSRQNHYEVQWWKIESGVWALISHYGYTPSHNSQYGDIETIYRGGSDYGSIVDDIKNWQAPSLVLLMHSHKYGNHGVVAVGYKYHADWWGWHDKRLFIHDTWYHKDENGHWRVDYLVEYHVDGDFSWWDPVAHYDVLNFYPHYRPWWP